MKHSSVILASVMALSSSAWAERARPPAERATAPSPSPSQPPAAAATPPPQKPAQPEKEEAPQAPKEAPADIDQRMDIALERFHAKKYDEAAARLYDAYNALPESDLRRDTAAFHLAQALRELGFIQAAIEHFVDIAGGRRAPDLVARSLEALDDLVRRRELDEGRLIDGLLFGNQYGDLPTDTQEFVNYYQALGELRRGYSEWGTHRLEELAPSTRYYGWRARHALAVERLAQGNDEGAEKIWKEIIAAENAPAAVRNDARQALARQYYDRKQYDDAFDQYMKIDSPLPLQDIVLLEKAWDRVAAHDEPRALGMVVGLGAPIFHHLFAPEQSLIRAVALKRLCQFRAAHLAVMDFRAKYGELLNKIRDRQPLNDDPVLSSGVMARDDLLPMLRWRELLSGEKAKLSSVGDAPLKAHLDVIYSTKLAQAESIVGRGISAAYERAAEELLRVNEQLSILDYEIGVGLFKGSGDKTRRDEGTFFGKIPYGGTKVYYRFSGEYWSDELNDFVVLANDRCVR